MHAGSLSQDCTSGFMDRDILTARAMKIGSEQSGLSSNRLTENRQRVIIPGMNFSCSGTITSFKLGVDIRNTNGGNLTLQLWRPVTTSGQLQYQFVESRDIFLRAGIFSSNGVNEYILPNPLTFQSGYMIAVFQPVNSRTRLFHSTSKQASAPAGFVLEGSMTDKVPATGHRKFNGYLLLRPVISERN